MLKTSLPIHNIIGVSYSDAVSGVQTIAACYAHAHVRVLRGPDFWAGFMNSWKRHIAALMHDKS